MNGLKDRAIAHITEQMMADSENSAIRCIEEHLTGLCMTDTVAEKLLVPGKTLKGALSEIESTAKQISRRGVVCVPPDEGFRIVERYYGIDGSDKTAHASVSKPKVVDLFDF